MTAEQLEAARAERMRQNGHGAITIEDVRTWIEETGLCIFLPRSAQAGFTAPTFVEAIAGQRTTEPTHDLVRTAEELLVRLEADGVAVRLNLAGQPAGPQGNQPDYVVASWVLPYVYALRGDRDWRRTPQLTGSRQVSQLAVQAAKQLDTANMTAAQVRDGVGREVTETAVLRALHELWKQLRIIPVVPQAGHYALWQPLRQRFQKAIAEGASTSQVTAISVLASIYLQAVIAASMEDIELFLSPLTSRSKIREVVRGLAATRQVHSTTIGHSPMFYVAGTLPEFSVAPSFQINGSYPSYLSQYSSRLQEDESIDCEDDSAIEDLVEDAVATVRSSTDDPKAASAPARPAFASAGQSPLRQSSLIPPKPSIRPSADRRRAPASRAGTANGNGVRSNNGARSNSAAGYSSNGTIRPGESRPSNNFGNGSRFSKSPNFSESADAANGSNGPANGDSNNEGGALRPPRTNWALRPAGERSSGPSIGAGARSSVRTNSRPAPRGGEGFKPISGSARPSPRVGGSNQSPRPRSAEDGANRKSQTGPAKRFSFSSQARPASRARPAAARSPEAQSRDAQTRESKTRG